MFSAKECLQLMIFVNPAHRVSAAEVLDHSWITVSNTSGIMEMGFLSMRKQRRRSAVQFTAQLISDFVFATWIA